MNSPAKQVFCSFYICQVYLCFCKTPVYNAYKANFQIIMRVGCRFAACHRLQLLYAVMNKCGLSLTSYHFPTLLKLSWKCLQAVFTYILKSILWQCVCYVNAKRLRRGRKLQMPILIQNGHCQKRRNYWLRYESKF